MTEEHPTIEEQRKLLDAAGDDVPEPPPYIESMRNAVVMEEDDPERFRKLMSEGSGDDPLEIVGRAIAQLPDRLADRLGAP